MKRAKVVFEYTPQEEDELKLGVGDIILEVEAVDTGWCQGLLNGKRGMFPDNFVQMIENEEKPAPPPAQKKPSKKSTKRRMRATFAYKAENDDEISLEIGDIIEVLKDVEEGWAEGVSKGKRGVFPTNFVEKLPESSESEESGDGALEAPEPAKEPAAPSEEPTAAPTQKKVKGVGFGNIFGDGPIKLRQRSIGEADRKPSFSTPSSTKTVKEKEVAKEVLPSPSAKSKKSAEYCRVIFEYTKDNDDELTLVKGEIITVIAKDGGDDGWWEGEKMENGKKVKGVFPDNFVAMLSPDERREHEKQLQGKTDLDSSTDLKHAKSPITKETRPLSFRKTAPMIPLPPSQGAKPSAAPNSEVNHSDSTVVTLNDTATTEHTLAHVKRPAGPKNRRKPGAAERREKAESSASLEINGEEVDSDEEDKLNKVSNEVQTPKKESAKRGVAVLPGPEGGSGETPSWLQNLKNRQSQKRPPAAAVVSPQSNKDTPQTDSKPAWMQNLKKRQSSEFSGVPGIRPAPKPEEPQNKEKAPLQPPEKVALQPPKQPEKPQASKPSNGHAPIFPPAKPSAAVKPPQRPPAPAEKPLAAWQVERQQKKKKAETPADEPAPEPPVTAAAGEPAVVPSWKANVPRKSPVATKAPEVVQPVQKPKEKPPLTAPANVRAKPAPPKGKPAPAVKPASSSAVEELKEELKLMKEEMGRLRDEMKKEIFKLNEELLDEKKQRMQLQSEVAKLRLQLPS